jgi:hypothetical protein
MLAGSKKGICGQPHDSHIFVFDYCQVDILMVLIFPSRSSCLISSFFVMQDNSYTDYDAF